MVFQEVSKKINQWVASIWLSFLFAKDYCNLKVLWNMNCKCNGDYKTPSFSNLIGQASNPGHHQNQNATNRSTSRPWTASCGARSRRCLRPASPASCSRWRPSASLLPSEASCSGNLGPPQRAEGGSKIANRQNSVQGVANSSTQGIIFSWVLLFFSGWQR